MADQELFNKTKNIIMGIILTIDNIFSNLYNKSPYQKHSSNSILCETLDRGTYNDLIFTKPILISFKYCFNFFWFVNNGAGVVLYVG
ncbi:MAG: hypothetical protein ACYCXK_07060 [Candidatus Humimicrobiaceae bacterium]